jgi:two-component system response regulator FixJ
MSTTEAAPGSADGPSVLVVEDDPDWAALASEALGRAGLQVVVYATPADLLARPAWPRDGCLLLDVHLPGMDGVELLRELRRRGVGLPAVMMTAFADVPLAVRAMREGARDFVEKPFSPADLVGRVTEAMAAAAAEPRAADPDGELAARLTSLSPRERQVLELVVAGLPNKQVAARLELSVKTVELHRAHLMQKMRAGSLAELVRLTLRAGVGAAEWG